jgi:small subunit ribosomal protein S13
MKDNYNKKSKEEDVALIRVLGKDIRGDIKLISALTHINGISWSISNAICKILNLDKSKILQNISKETLLKIEGFMKNPTILSFIKNRQKDIDSGDDLHISASDLKLRKEFDLKRLKKIRSYKGIRHTSNLPVRGQRTKSNFRRNKKPSVAAAKKKLKNKA